MSDADRLATFVESISSAREAETLSRSLAERAEGLAVDEIGEIAARHFGSSSRSTLSLDSSSGREWRFSFGYGEGGRFLEPEEIEAANAALGPVATVAVRPFERASSAYRIPDFEEIDVLVDGGETHLKPKPIYAD